MNTVVQWIKRAPALLASVLDQVRWRMCWGLMPRMALAREKRRLEQIARANGASKSMARGIASAYFKSLKDQR